MEAKNHYSGHKNLQLVPDLTQLNPTGILTPSFFKYYFNIILLHKIMSLKWFLSYMFSDQNRVYISYVSSTFFMPCQSHSPRFVHVMISVEKYILWSSSSGKSNLTICMKNWKLLDLSKDVKHNLAKKLFITLNYYNTRLGERQNYTDNFTHWTMEFIYIVIQQFTSCLKEDTQSLHYEDKLVTAFRKIITVSSVKHA
jgi:hypothetical protein